MNVRRLFALSVVVGVAVACGPSDTAMQQRVDGILAHPDNDVAWLSGQVSKGTLTLTGTAPSEEAKAGAVSLAGQIPGLKGVVDQTVLDTVLIRRHSQKAACDAGVATALKAGQIGFSGTALTRPTRTILDQVALALEECPESNVEVAGYTDSSGSEAGNQRLSEQRAQAAVDYLVGKGVDRARLTAVGYGQAEPIADNGTPEGRAANRRLEFKIKL